MFFDARCFVLSTSTLTSAFSRTMGAAAVALCFFLHFITKAAPSAKTRPIFSFLSLPFLQKKRLSKPLSKTRRKKKKRTEAAALSMSSTAAGASGPPPRSPHGTAAEKAGSSSPSSSIARRSRESLLGLLSLPRQQAAARAADSSDSDSSSSFFALCYADAGVAESLRSLGVDAEVLAREASVALLCDLEAGGGAGRGGGQEEVTTTAAKAVSTAAALWRGRCSFEPRACKQQDAGHLFVLISSSSSLGAAAEVLRAHAGWAISGGGVNSGGSSDNSNTRAATSKRPSSPKTTVLVSPALAHGPRALAALAVTLEDAAGLKRRSLSGGVGGGENRNAVSSSSSSASSTTTKVATAALLHQLRGCEWSLAGARPSWFVLPERGEAGELSKGAWPLVPGEVEEEESGRDAGGESSYSFPARAAAVAAAAAFSTAAALSAGAAFQAGLKLDPFVVGTSPASKAVAEAVLVGTRGEVSADSSSSLLARAAKAAAAAASSALLASSAATDGNLRRAALVLIDSRSFSAGAALHDDHPLSRALCCCCCSEEAGRGAGKGGRGTDGGGEFPRRRGGDVEVSVSKPSSSSCSSSLCPPSSVLDSDDPWVDSLACRRSADAALLLRKWLRETARSAGVPVPARGRAGSAPPAELKALVDALGAETKARVSSTGRRARALAGAYAEAASGEGSKRWEAAAEAEKRLLSLVSEEGHDEEGSSSAAAVSAVAEELVSAFRRCAAKENGGSSDSPVGTGAALADALLLSAVGASLARDVGSLSSSPTSSSPRSPSLSFSSLFGEKDASRIRGEALSSTLSVYEAAVRASSKEARRELASEVGWRPTKERRGGGGGESESAEPFSASSSLEAQVEGFVDSFLASAARAAAARRWLPAALRWKGGNRTSHLSPAAELLERILKREPLPEVGDAAAADDGGEEEEERDRDNSDDDDDGGPSLRSLLRGALASAAATSGVGGFSPPPPKLKTKTASAAAAATASSKRKQVSDYDDVVLFFVGGLSPADARTVAGAVAAAAASEEASAAATTGDDDDDEDKLWKKRNARLPPRVLFGGSRLLAPAEVYRELVGAGGG